MVTSMGTTSFLVLVFCNGISVLLFSVVQVSFRLCTRSRLTIVLNLYLCSICFFSDHPVALYLVREIREQTCYSNGRHKFFQLSEFMKCPAFVQHEKRSSVLAAI